MNCSYYSIFRNVNTNMKFVLVVYMCLAGACESVYERDLYDTVEECKAASEEVRVVAQQMFPMSSGQVWCLTEDEFKKYQDYYDITDET